MRISERAYELTLSKQHQKLALVLAFSAAFAFFPWPHLFLQIYKYPMIDRFVYEFMVTHHTLPTDYIQYVGLKSYILYEYLWNFGLAYMVREVGLSTDTVFQAVTFMCILVFALITVRISSTWALLLLLNPLLIDLCCSQLRLAFALSLLGIAVLSRSKVAMACLAATALVIHSASAIFILLFWIASFLGNGSDRTGSDRTEGHRILKVAVLVFLGFGISLSTGPFRFQILTAVGDRRAFYPEASSTIAYLSFWIFLFFVLLLDYKNTLKSQPQRYALAILAIVVMNVATSGYSLRFLAATFPFLVSAILRVSRDLILFVLLPFIFYVGLQWVYWLMPPRSALPPGI